MPVSHKMENQYLVFSLAGRMDVNVSSQMEREISQVFNDNPGKNVILNLEDIEYMSSSGLRVFVSIMRQLQEKNLKLRLCNLSPAVRKVFEIVELMDLFEIFESEEEALSH